MAGRSWQSRSVGTERGSVWRVVLMAPLIASYYTRKTYDFLPSDILAATYFYMFQYILEFKFEWNIKENLAVKSV